MKNIFSIFFILTIILLGPKALANKKDKHLRWEARESALAITFAEIDHNQEAYFLVEQANDHESLKEAMLGLAGPSERLYEWAKKKTGSQRYIYDKYFFSWLVDVCDELVKLGNLSSPTQILSAILFAKNWDLREVFQDVFYQKVLLPQLGVERAQRFVAMLNGFVATAPRYYQFEEQAQKNNSHGFIPNPVFWGKALDTAQVTEEEIDLDALKDLFHPTVLQEMHDYISNEIYDPFGYKKSIVKYFRSCMAP